MTLKIGITGHRKLEDSLIVRQKIKEIITKILQSKKAEIFEAYTSLAIGSDSIFAEVALEMGGVVKVVLPMPVDEYQKDFESNEIVLFNNILKHDANPQITESKIPHNDQDRNEAYYKAGKLVVDSCDVMIAVWDGEKSNGRGGTADIVKYAKETNKQLHYIKSYRSDISRLFWKYDKKAIYYKNIYEWLWKLSIFLSLSAALILSAYLSFHLEYYKVILTKIEFVAVLLALGIIFYLKWGKLNKNRIVFRRAAERLRVIEKFDKGGINIEKLDSNNMPQDIIHLEVKYQSIAYPQNNFTKSRSNILHLIDEQIVYHSNKRPEIKSKTYHFLERLQFPLLILFFIGVLFHFFAVLIEGKSEHLSHILHSLGLMLSLSIPPLYAAIEGYIYFKEYHKIFTDSEKMGGFFKNVNEVIKQIDVVDTANFTILNNYAFQIMEKMDAENKEWTIWFGRPKTPGI
jgi:hypothetical protein